jgi:lipoprotein-releasing system permease protein
MATDATPRGTRAFAAFEWMIAARYLRPTRKEGFVSVISILSLLGVAVGVAALIIVMSVMNGFRHDLLGRILGVNGHITITSLAGNMPNFDKIASRVRAVPGVLHVTPVVDGEVMGTSSGVVQGVLVRGMRAEDLKALTMVSKTLSEGALERFRGGNAIIIGGRMAEKMRVGPGLDLTLIAPRGNVTPFGVTPRVKSYTVVGTFNVGMSQYDANIVFMPIDEAQLYFNMGDTASGLEVMIKDPDHVNAMVDPIQRAAGPYARILTWQEQDETFFDALQVERNVMFMILTLIILVAALNIISGLIMLVKDKSADIAILRTMGATRGAVMRVFLIAGASIGVTGTILGFVIGVVFCLNIENIRQFLSSLTGTQLFNPEIYFLSRMPARMEPTEVIAVLIMSLTLSFLATLYPSWRAARLDPVEALRYE